jgi:LDH2 family malate/lactate/ureidoglycolate dehydrogenase
MQLTIGDATELATRILVRHGMSSASAKQVAHHLVDANLCGHEFSGLPRLLAIVNELDAKAAPGDIRVIHETACSAVIDGGDNIAYVVTVTAIDKAVAICRKNGVALVCANNTWFSGRLAYYVERAARQGYIAMHTTNTTARVAPYGGIDRIMGTNPFTIAFPSNDEPLIIDIATASTSWGDVLLNKEKGEALPSGVALDGNGKPTLDPDAALGGAFLAWGGVRGSALSMAVQLLGIFAGSAGVIHDTNNWGLFFLVADPDALMPGTNFKARVSEFRQSVAASRPVAGAGPVRLPGDGSLVQRQRAIAAGFVSVDDKVYAKLLELAG